MGLGGSSGPSGAGGGNSSSGGVGGGGGDGGDRNTNNNLPPANQPPVDIFLSRNEIRERKRKGTRIGELSALDPDSAAPFTYRLVSGEGSNDNGAFKIVGDVLIADREFDYEQDNSYSIRVAVQDSSGKIFQKRFTIRIDDLKSDNRRVIDANSKPSTSLFLGNLTKTFSKKDTIGQIEKGRRDRDDYFSVNLTQSGSLTVRLKQLKADADFQIFDAAGKRIGQSKTNGSKSDIWTSNFLSAGTYTIRVYPDKVAKTRYVLSLNTAPIQGSSGTDSGSSPGAVPLDPNGTFDSGALNSDQGVIPVFNAAAPLERATAPLIIGGSIGFTETYGRDVDDYYKFTLADRSSLGVSLSDLTGDADLELYDSNGTLLGQSKNSGTQPDALLGFDFAPGTYYARVTPYGNTQTTYSLSLIADTPYYGFGSILYAPPNGGDHYLGTLNSQYSTDPENSNLLPVSGTVSPTSDEFYGFRAGSFTNNDIYITLFTLADGANLQIYNSSFEEIYYTTSASYSSSYGEYYETVNLSALDPFDGLKTGELYYARVTSSGGSTAAFGLNVSDAPLV